MKGINLAETRKKSYLFVMEEEKNYVGVEEKVINLLINNIAL